MSEITLLSELAEVTVSYETSQPSKYIVPVADLDLFFAATIKLHYAPGVNPHNGNKTTRACRIEARALEVDNDYLWWADPLLAVVSREEAEDYAETKDAIQSLRSPEQYAAGRASARTIKPGKILKEWRSPEQIERDDNNPGDND